MIPTMIEFTPIGTSHADYAFVERLMTESFPPAERRTEADQRQLTDHEERFSCLLITDGALRVGFITLWRFPGFTYAEHLATSPEVRNRGYGKQVMQRLAEYIPGLIVLEVEPPEDEMSRRRIGFYERCGFTLSPYEYLQPPYRPGGEPFPLRIMTAGSETFTHDRFVACRELIYRHVYRYQPAGGGA